MTAMPKRWQKWSASGSVSVTLRSKTSSTSWTVMSASGFSCCQSVSKLVGTGCPRSWWSPLRSRKLQEPFYRRNFTLAHEYGHALVDLSDASTPQAWIDFASEGHRRNHSERFADAFAAAFLMPRRAVLAQLDRIMRTNAGQFTDYDLVHLAMHFGVSGQAMSLRLVTLRKLSRQAQRDYWEQRSFKPIAEALGYDSRG